VGPGPIRAGPRFERPLSVAPQDAAGPEGELDEAVAIGLFEIRSKDRDAITCGRAARLGAVNGLTQPPYAGHRPAEFILAVSQTVRRSHG